MTVTARRLRAHGLSVAVPPGWHARIDRRVEAQVAAPGTGSIPVSGTVHPVLHLATVPLPARRGDYGSGVVETMGRNDVFVCLAQFDAEAGATELFADGELPLVRAVDFSPTAQQRVIPGMCGTQRFVNVRGRAFCVYVVLGSWRGRAGLVPLANRAIDAIDLD